MNVSKNSIIIILSFCVAIWGAHESLSFFDWTISSRWGRFLYFYSWYALIPLMVTTFLYGHESVLENLGLAKDFPNGLKIGLLASLPMFIGFALTGQLNTERPVFDIAFSALRAGFFEELLFRGFLFGLLFRYTRWGFIPAALLGAIIFACLHLYQGESY